MCLRSLGGILHQRGDASDLEPAQAGPVVVLVVVQHQADFRVGQDVADAPKLARIAPLRLLVNRRVDLAVEQGEADRHGVWLAGWIDGGEASAALLGEERRLLRRDFGWVWLAFRRLGHGRASLLAMAGVCFLQK